MQSCVTQNDTVLLCGGTDPLIGRCSEKAYMIRDPIDNPGLLTRIQDMVYQRWAHAVVPIFKKVFAIGGYSNKQKLGAIALSLKSCEAF